MGITRRMALIILAGAIFIAAGMYMHLDISIFILYNTVTAGLFILDFKMTPGNESFRIERVYDGIFEIEKEKKVSIRVSNLSSRNVFVELKDTIPAEMINDGQSLSIPCAPGESAFADYTVRPVKRGSFLFGTIFARCRGVLGLCTKGFKVQCDESIPVYPDLYPMKRYHLLSQKRLLHHDDASIHKIYGIGTDFQYLREYTTDDEYRKINWNATARSNKLITGVYDIEKNQNVIICIDTDRTMISTAGGLSRLDHSIQSALVLSQVAIDMGDQVGLLVFGSDINLFIKPAKGASQQNRILKAVYSLQPGYYESDFGQLASYLQTYQRKRSLVCIFSHPRDEETCRELTASLSPLARKHALLMVSILNPGLRTILNNPAEKLQDAYTKAAASYRLDTEHNASTIMSRSGIMNIMVEPDQLTPEVINRYIAMKKVMKIS